MLGADIQKSSNIFTDLMGMSGKSEKHLREKAIAVLASLGVSHLSERLPHELSYPDSKKVALARALISEPLLLMLDEPAAGLDQGDIDELARIINEVKRNCAVLSLSTMWILLERFLTKCMFSILARLSLLELLMK